MEIVTKEEFRRKYIKRARMFMLIGLGVILFFGMISLAYFTGAVQPEETDGIIVPSFVVGIVLLIFGFISSIPLFVLSIVNFSNSKGQKLEDNYSEYVTEAARKQQKAEEKEDRIAKEKAEQLAKISADFPFNKVIKISESENVWINTESKMIQFLIRAVTANEKADSGVAKEKIRVYKTKVFHVNDIKSCEIQGAVSVNKQISSSGVRTSSAISGGVNFDSTNVSEKTETSYELQIRINDLDYPFLAISFGTDGTTPTIIKDTIEMLQAK